MHTTMRASNMCSWEGNLMQDDYYMSDEESEWKADQALELLINDPGYRLASWDEFCADKKIITAKRLWLQFTERGQSVPSDIVEVLFKAILKEVIDYDIEHDQGNYQRLDKKIYEHALFELLSIAKEDLDNFWKLLHEPTDLIFANMDTSRGDILKILREWLPERRKFKAGELYSLFDELDQTKDAPPRILPFLPKVARQGFISKFRRWRKQNKLPFRK